MGLFDVGAGTNTFSSGSSTVGNIASNVVGAIGAVGRIAGISSNLSNPSQLISQLRSANLPIGGNINAAIRSAGAQWGGSEASGDWRVRLSMPTDPTYSSSPVLAPLREAGGMIFPYTPSISITANASYEETVLTHQNYAAISYQNSRLDQIQITAPFYVEDAVQAQYWLAAVHYFRSVTKMYSGDTGETSGNPPPIVLLNGYGDYVFKNIPVVVKGFSLELPQDVNYIATTVGQNLSSRSSAFVGPIKPNSPSLAQRTMTLAGLAGAVGSAQAAQALALGSLAISGYQAYQRAKNSNGASLLSPSSVGGFGGGSAGNSHVPIKSTMTITLMPIYSRESMRKFNLNTFVSGGYVNNNVGYL